MQTNSNPTEAKNPLPEALKRFPAAVQMVERVDAARSKVQSEFHDHVLRAQAHLTDWQGKAATFVGKAQEKARAEKDEVTQRVEALIAKLPTDLQAKVSPSAVLHARGAALLAAWLKLPADVRDDVLTVAGVATAKQTAAVLEEIVALRAEITLQRPQTESKDATPARRRARKEDTPAQA